MIQPARKRLAFVFCKGYETEEKNAMKHPIYHAGGARLVCVMLLVCALLASSNATALAAEEGSPDTPQISPPPVTEAAPAASLYPADVQTIVRDNTRQIVKTYTLTSAQSPDAIPREAFERDGWRYTLTDITQQHTSILETRRHIETVTIETDTQDIADIIPLLASTMTYQGEDGYSGLLTLDLSSVSCEASGHKSSSYSVSASREYPHLSTNDLALIPKTITENGRTLALDTVTWEVLHTVNVDYEDIPESYCAIAKYTATASRSMVTGYVTTAHYMGDISKSSDGDTVYTAYFSGHEIAPPTQPEVIEPLIEEDSSPSILPLIVGAVMLAALAGAFCAYCFLRHNVKVYRIKSNGERELTAKLRLTPKTLVIDLTPLEKEVAERRFRIELDSSIARRLNNMSVDIILGNSKLQHRIAFEGGTYTLDVDFDDGTANAIY